jgi:hypothetical protein
LVNHEGHSSPDCSRGLSGLFSVSISPITVVASPLEYLAAPEALKRYGGDVVAHIGCSRAAMRLLSKTQELDSLVSLMYKSARNR